MILYKLAVSPEPEGRRPSGALADASPNSLCDARQASLKLLFRAKPTPKMFKNLLVPFVFTLTVTHTARADTCSGSGPNEISFRTRVAAGVALVVVLALSYVDSALAVTCAANTYSPSTSVGASGCTDCPTGTTAAATPSGNARTYCEGIAADYYGTAGNVNSADAVVTACTTTFSHSSTGSGAITSAASTSTTTKTACKTAPGYYITTNANVADTAIRVAIVPAGKYIAGGTALVSHATNANTGTAAETPTNCAAGKFSAAGDASCTNCAAGKDSTTGDAFCGKIAAGYWGTAGAVDGGGAYTGHAGSVTACTTTFSNGGTAAGITSAESGTTTARNACKTAPGYYITTNANVADTAIRVAIVPAGKYIAGGTALVTHATQANKGTPAETASTCAAGTSSAAGAASCTNCDAGKYSAVGDASCTD